MITIKGIDPQMIANNLAPSRPLTHPGDLLKEELEYRGISQRKFAAQIGVSYTAFNEVLNCKRPVNTELALLVEAALGIDSEMLAGMQINYNLQAAQKNKIFTRRLNEIRKMASVL